MLTEEWRSMAPMSFYLMFDISIDFATTYLASVWTESQVSLRWVYQTRFAIEERFVGWI